MARIKLTLSANAGGALQLGSHRLLIDALHNGKIPGFSTLDADLREKVLNHPDFVNPELICLTHDHPDHYSDSLLQAALRMWPEAKCLMSRKMHLNFDDMELTFFSCTHDGAQFENVPHCGILIGWDGKNILIPGDCRIGDDALLQVVLGKQIDLAILNFPWLTLKKGRVCLENVIKPKKCVFWHLPFAGDDVNGYRSSAESALHQYAADAQLLYDPLQSIELDI